ncbi:sugar ABC transporter permease [Paenibacillus spongiae]|uniref:Sugar ABC transporter permease n=2 Tax=Paenibacillus spongiae TaxID=2909671 RepID=A0ABY5SIB8_9BACL|nr:sugar ABC transporter permease [Paenibacillus spongiae]UVI33786.1 sugar ABC transporter permease [Paenibacillus spongiae]
MLKITNLVKDIWKHRQSYLFVAPFYIMFLLFILIPIIAGILLSFTYFNAVQFPTWVGWKNYQNLFSQDIIFLQHVVPNSFKFALFVGPLGYVCAFFLAWLIAQLPTTLRTIFALAIYAPSLTAGIAMTVVWQVMFTGDRTGYLNSFLLKWGIIEKPVLFVQHSEILMNIMIIVSVWASMGIGFLAILAGILNVDKQLYEAGRIDGISSRLQEIWYITVPLMKPQLMFAAIMSIVYTLKSGAIGTQLSGSNPTPNYAGQLMINHIDDYGFIRYELGYASAISVVLLGVCYLLSRMFGYLFAPKEGE